MKSLFVILISASLLVSCGHRSGVISSHPNYIDKSSEEIVSRFGVPASITISEPSGPFDKPFQIITYYVEGDEGKISPYYFWVQNGIVVSHSAHLSRSSRIIRAESQNGIDLILRSITAIQ